jgi:hypothetical protein
MHGVCATLSSMKKRALSVLLWRSALGGVQIVLVCAGTDVLVDDAKTRNILHLGLSLPVILVLAWWTQRGMRSVSGKSYSGPT